jgi:hypothetical protein
MNIRNRQECSYLSGVSSLIKCLWVRGGAPDSNKPIDYNRDRIHNTLFSSQFTSGHSNLDSLLFLVGCLCGKARSLP